MRPSPSPAVSLGMTEHALKLTAAALRVAEDIAASRRATSARTRTFRPGRCCRTRIDPPYRAISGSGERPAAPSSSCARRARASGPRGKPDGDPAGHVDQARAPAQPQLHGCARADALPDPRPRQQAQHLVRRVLRSEGIKVIHRPTASRRQTSMQSASSPPSGPSLSTGY